MESWVNFGGKEGHTNVQHSAEPGFEPGTLWLEGRDPTTAPTMPLLNVYYMYQNGQINCKKNNFFSRMELGAKKVCEEKISIYFIIAPFFQSHHYGRQMHQILLSEYKLWTYIQGDLYWEGYLRLLTAYFLRPVSGWACM